MIETASAEKSRGQNREEGIESKGRKEQRMSVKVIGIGKYLPERVVVNDEISDHVDTNHEWILDRTGISQRHIATEETSLDMSAAAAEQALEGVDRESIGLVVFATITPDHVTPSMAAEVKKRLGLKHAVAFDINAACSGFIYAIWIAESLMEGKIPAGEKNDDIKRALVIGSERLSRITNWEDRETCILFGDGAGAAVLERDDEARGIISTYVKNYDDENEVISCKANYINSPFWEDDLTPQPLRMQGRAVFRFAVSAVEEVLGGALRKADMTYDDVDWFVLHQANGRIIEAVAKKLGQPLDKFQISIEKSANVSSATVPMALFDLQESGKLKKGDIIALVGFGGGLCAAAAVVEC